MDITEFNHRISETVKFHEVDMLGVCNNAVYFNYFEDARIKYMQDIKKNFELKEVLEGESFFIMVHNNCDYLQSAHLDDELIVHTKISFIKKTSFGFDHIITRKSDNAMIAKGGGVVVHINKSEKVKMPIPREFYEAVTKFEKTVEIL